MHHRRPPKAQYCSRNRTERLNRERHTAPKGLLFEDGVPDNFKCLSTTTVKEAKGIYMRVYLTLNNFYQTGLTIISMNHKDICFSQFLRRISFPTLE